MEGGQRVGTTHYLPPNWGYGEIPIDGGINSTQSQWSPARSSLGGHINQASLSPTKHSNNGEKLFIYFLLAGTRVVHVKKKLLFNEQQTAEAERSRNLNGFGCLESSDSGSSGGGDGDQSFKTNGL